MSKKARSFWALILAAQVFASGCKPVEPFYFGENPDLAHYMDVATKQEYPDVHEVSLPETELAGQPLSLENPEPRELWDLTLEEAIQISLTNGKVLKQIGGGISNLGVGTNALAANVSVAPVPSALRNGVRSFIGQPTVYDPALQETNAASPATQGVESALADFDAQFTTSLFWNRQDQPQNAGDNPIFPAVQRGDTMNVISELNKRTAAGTQLFFRNNTTYTETNSPFAALPSDWLTNFETEVRQPLMRGAGTQVNRVPVVLARIRTDISLAQFECDVRNHVFDTEKAYWELYFAYRNLEAQKRRRDIVHAIWWSVETTKRTGLGTKQSEAVARQEYLEARARVEAALGDLFKAENRLRFMLGLAPTDGRLIRPVDEPISARVHFDWRQSLCEGLARSCELRIKRWQVKQRETEMITARNALLPRMDAVALYRWLGRGDDLISDNDGPRFPAPGSDAMEELFHGDYQEWRLGFEFALPVGFRRELAGMRNAQLQLAKERALLQETELELAHQLTDVAQNIDNWYQISQTNFNRQIATRDEVDGYIALIRGEVGGPGARGISENLEFLLQAIRRDADAQSLFYRSLLNYTISISEMHFHKGSLLEYDNVLLAEGPWPQKAYFDAQQQARQRAAGHYLNYGYTRPRVISRGEYEQFQNTPNGWNGPQREELERLPEENIDPPQPLPGPLPDPTPEPAPPAGVDPAVYHRDALSPRRTAVVAPARYDETKERKVRSAVWEGFLDKPVGTDAKQ